MPKPFGASTATWVGVAALLLVLGLAVYFLVIGWGPPEEDGLSMTTGGYVAMAFGIIATLALGIGLMTLVFYSNRKG